MKQIWLLSFVFFVASVSTQSFYKGVDLSYVNELEDCGVVYQQEHEAGNPYSILKEQGSDLARFRLWHTPNWSGYSNLEDVKKSIQRAKAQQMAVLLDFHYSDTWADPSNQLRPAAWNGVSDLGVLGDSVYNYTLRVLENLHAEDLAPNMVQIGNETNGNIMLLEGEAMHPIDWDRNIFLFNKGIDAVHDFNTSSGLSVKTMIHIAQPENGLWWFAEAKNKGFTQFDIIGLSYYPGWSVLDVRQAADAVEELIAVHDKEVMLVETGYPWTLDWADNAANLLDADNLLKTFGQEPSPQNQFEFLSEFTWLVKNAGGSGVVFWEPAWVSSDCPTQWGQGSHWENVALFDFDCNLHAGADYLGYDYSQMPDGLASVSVRFRVDMTGVDVSNSVFVTGDFTGENWQFMEMQPVGENIFELQTQIPGRSVGAYIFQNKADWGESWREPLPEDCALFWGTHREFVVENEPLELGFVWGSCTPIGETGILDIDATEPELSPNPAYDKLRVHTKNPILNIELVDLEGASILKFNTQASLEIELDVSGIEPGVYLVRILDNEHKMITKKFIKK